MNQKPILLSLSLIALALAAGCANEATSDMPILPDMPEKKGGTTPAKEAPKLEIPASVTGERSDARDSVPVAGEEVGVIETNKGKIVFRFFQDKAPATVASFKKLAREGFYNGCTFHRVIPGFMIQGGDPNSKDADKSNDGTGGPGFTLPNETSEISHVRGILSMANSGSPETAGSQFFVMHQENTSLDTKYSVFGQVVKSGKEAKDAESEYLKTVDKIVSVPRNGSDNPDDRIEMKVSIQKWPIK